MGDVCCDYREEFSQTVFRTLDKITSAEVIEILERLSEQATGWLEQEGISRSQQKIFYNADMRYFRQGYELPITTTLDALRNTGIAALAEQFHALHEQLYRFRLDAECEIVNLRAIALGTGTTLHWPEGETDGPAAAHAQIDEHRIYFDGDFLTTPIYDRAKLKPGNQLPGPAIVTEMDATTVVLPNFAGEIDTYFNILIRPAA